ncbi:MAG: tRNA (N(6)-L-threonylcarbamoyladenosine(37)-C(2))-methylthiotransferase MtaB [Pseudomonadota bacterium]
MSLYPVDQTKGRKKAAVLTLGCKVNQFESAAMVRMLERQGYTPAGRDQPADLTVVNTCTVTHRADVEAGTIIRRAYRLNPQGRILVTGCLAQTRPAEMAALPGVTLVLGQNYKADFLTFFEDSNRGGTKVDPPGRDRKILDLGYPRFDRTRAFFRLQDGCSARCSYCIVPLARGPSRSLEPESVLEGLDHYAREGYEEVVLTGIHLGAWGLDLRPPTSLTSLIVQAEAQPNLSRLRLSSIEPNEVTPGLRELSSGSSRLCPHLHLPLQSGSDRILAAMRRPYTADLFRRLVLELKAGREDICLGADVLVGFPGEDQEAFLETYRLVEELPLSYLHVFRYSRRPGTTAEAMPDQTPQEEKKRRVAALRRLGESKRLHFYRRSLGRVRPTLVENTPDRQTGLARGLTNNYIPVLITEPAFPAGLGHASRVTSAAQAGHGHAEVRLRRTQAGRLLPVRLVELTSGGRVLGRPEQL